MAIAANILVVAFEIVGLRIAIADRGVRILAYYTQISNIVALVSSLAFLVLGSAAAPLRYLSSCMLVMTFLITVCVLIPMGGDFKKLMLLDNGLYHHTLCPIVSVASYVLWEAHASMPLIPIAATMVYGFTLLGINAARKVDGPYPFFRVYKQSLRATVLWVIALIAIITAISLGVAAVAK